MRESGCVAKRWLHNFPSDISRVEHSEDPVLRPKSLKLVALCIVTQNKFRGDARRLMASPELPKDRYQNC